MGDRAAVLAAVAKLAAANGYDYLTVPRIRAGAGVSRKTFNAHFEGVEDCFLEALEARVDDLFDHADRAQRAGRHWPGGLYRSFATLCTRIADDRILTDLCLADNFKPGSNGSRYRQRIASLVAERIENQVPPDQLPSAPAIEASKGAVWSVFHHHVIRDPAQQGPRAAATLSYLALVPAIGASGAVDAIRREQVA